MTSESKLLSRAVTVCCSTSVLVQMTVAPIGTEIATGAKLKFAMCSGVALTGDGRMVAAAVGEGAEVGVGTEGAWAQPIVSRAPLSTPSRTRDRAPRLEPNTDRPSVG